MMLTYLSRDTSLSLIFQFDGINTLFCKGGGGSTEDDSNGKFSSKNLTPIVAI